MGDNRLVKKIVRSTWEDSDWGIGIRKFVVPRKDRRKVSEALALTALGLKVNEISQISLKLPGNAIIRVCKHCSDQVAKVERLETEMAATRSRIVQLVDQHAQHWQRRKRTLSPSF